MDSFDDLLGVVIDCTFWRKRTALCIRLWDNLDSSETLGLVRVCVYYWEFTLVFRLGNSINRINQHVLDAFGREDGTFHLETSATRGFGTKPWIFVATPHACQNGAELGSATIEASRRPG